MKIFLCEEHRFSRVVARATDFFLMRLVNHSYLDVRYAQAATVDENRHAAAL